MDCAIRPKLVSGWRGPKGCKGQGERSAAEKNHEHEFKQSRILDRGRFGRTGAAQTQRRLYADQPRQSRAAQTHQAWRSADLLSAALTLGGRDKPQSFTAIGTVKNGEACLFDIGGGFKPYRRDVEWAGAEEASIHQLLDQRELTAGKPNWGYQLRLGLFPISAADFRLIARAMKAVV
jgi:hypothetical protein